MDNIVDSIERMRRIAEEFGASREAMDMYNVKPLVDDEIIVGNFPQNTDDDLMCVPCAREVLGSEKVDWLLAQRLTDITDADGNTFQLWVYEPFDVGECERCGRPLMHPEPFERGAPAGVIGDDGKIYCREHAHVLLGHDLAEQVMAPGYDGLAAAEDLQGQRAQLQFANGSETWKLICGVCGNHLAPPPEDMDEDDSDELDV